MSDPIPNITVYKDEKMPMAHPKPVGYTNTAQIRRICRYVYGDDLSTEDPRPEPERPEVAWGYLSRDYQASLVAQQEGAYMREDSGVAGFKVSARPPQNAYNSGTYGMNGTLQAQYGQQQHPQQQHHQLQHHQSQQYQPYRHPGYTQAADSPELAMPSTAYSRMKRSWQSITGIGTHTQDKKVKDESWYC
ncbi:uncharacterized protein BKA78DRAFT_345150 [Phyllosticta capitalensis]|uniref:uncharacterized protein n=1 Tax=Phyllosticta capitalensis TaxID=121624 RepID=UPI00312E5666